LYDVSADGCVSYGVVCDARGIRGVHVACDVLGARVFECVARVVCEGGAGVACGSFAVLIEQVVLDGCVPHVARGIRVAYVACVALSACVFVKSAARVACGGETDVACDLVVVPNGQVVHDACDVHGSCEVCFSRDTCVMHGIGAVSEGEST
jgi:hypothetical protein